MTENALLKELFPLETPEQRLSDEVKLRMKAGAEKCWYEKQPSNWVLYTKW